VRDARPAASVEENGTGRPARRLGRLLGKARELDAAAAVWGRGGGDELGGCRLGAGQRQRIGSAVL
jgi:hypothetical protein